MVTPDEIIAERVARNQSTFRAANERIDVVAERVVDTGERLPFICECPEPSCTDLVAMTLAEYETVRDDPRRFFARAGHETCEVDGMTVAKVLERREGYSLLEKVGRAAEVAEELDTRE
ncbi:MAG: hypothetical protein ACTHKS_06870 [Gaiellaceae bacterium]